MPHVATHHDFLHAAKDFPTPRPALPVIRIAVGVVLGMVLGLALTVATAAL